MKLSLGIKSDPIESRYSFDWLFELMAELDLQYMQLGSFPEVFTLEDGYFHELRERAARKGVAIKSCFTTHRDLGGFFRADTYMEKAARTLYERYIQVASLVGSDSVGGNPGSVYRDRMETKAAGIACYLRHMEELMALAREKGLKSLHLEPMSSLAEPPTLPEELNYMLGTLNGYHQRHPQTTVPVYLCSDIGHGYADAEGKVVYDNWRLFEHQVPYMAEFHFKNTDALFDSTFGFSAEESKRGIVDLIRLKQLIEGNRDRFPVDHLVGYLEIGGPKLGRDYSDRRLRDMIEQSIAPIKDCFG